MATYQGLDGMEHHVGIGQQHIATAPVQPAPAAVVAVNSEPHAHPNSSAVSVTINPGTTQTVVTTLAHPGMDVQPITATPVTVEHPHHPVHQATAVTVGGGEADGSRPVRHYKSKTLPQGCKEVVKTRKSGATYKVWVDPSGREFRTLRALLTHVTGKSPTPRQAPVPQPPGGIQNAAISATAVLGPSASRVRSRADAGLDDGQEGLPAKPKRPRTAYAYFFAHANASVRADQPEGETHGAWVAKETARRWKTLTDDSKKPFAAKAAIDRERFNTESRVYKAALRKSEKNGGEFGIPLPKRPPNSYALFYKSVYEKVRADRSSGGREDVGSAAKTIGAMWKALPETEQASFKEQAKAELQKYHERMKEYNAAIKKARQDREQQQQQAMARQQQERMVQQQHQQAMAQQLEARAQAHAQAQAQAQAHSLQAHAVSQVHQQAAAVAAAAAAAADGDTIKQVGPGVAISVAPQLAAPQPLPVQSAPGAAQINAGAVAAANAAQMSQLNAAQMRSVRSVVVPSVVSQQQG